MPDEESNVEEAAEAFAEERSLAEQPVTDAELLSAAGLDENLMPISEGPAKAKGKASPTRDSTPESEEDEEEPASGENAGEADEEEPAAEEDEQSEDEAEEDEEGSPEEEAPKAKGWRKMQARIAKLTARAHELEGQLSQAQKVTLQPSEANPLSNLETEAEVNNYMAFLRDRRRWCFENWEGGEMPMPNGEPVERSAQEVRRTAAYIDDVLQTHAYARIKFLRERANCDEMARADYPELFVGSSQEARIAADFLARCPEILKLPNYRLIIGDAIRGMRQRIAKANGKSTSGPASAGGRKAVLPAAGVKLAPKAIRTAAASQTRARAAGTASRLEREFLATGNKNKLTEMFAATL